MKTHPKIDEGDTLSALFIFHKMLTEEEKTRLGDLIKNIKALIDSEPSLPVKTMALVSVWMARDPDLIGKLHRELDKFYNAKGRK